MPYFGVDGVQFWCLRSFLNIYQIHYLKQPKHLLPVDVSIQFDIISSAFRILDVDTKPFTTQIQIVVFLLTIQPLCSKLLTISVVNIHRLVWYVVFVVVNMAVCRPGGGSACFMPRVEIRGSISGS